MDGLRWHFRILEPSNHLGDWRTTMLVPLRNRFVELTMDVRPFSVATKYALSCSAPLSEARNAEACAPFGSAFSEANR
jgi:hypothetical protein